MKQVYFSQIKRYIDTLTNPETFWDDVRTFLMDKAYSDHTIKQGQIYAEQRYTKIGGMLK